jgi:carbamoyl-phosphate synthase large subunit
MSWGLMNVQFAIKDGDIYVLEVNPRASRTVPFVAKATDSAIASIAARLMAGEKLSAFPCARPIPQGVGPDTDLPLADPLTLADPITPWFSVKEAVLPFARFPGVDTLLGPEMRSTGEVMGWDRSFPLAFLKAQMGAGTFLPEGGRVFVSVKDADKTRRCGALSRAVGDGVRDCGHHRGTANGWAQGGSTAVRKVYEGRPNIVDRLKDGEIALVFNTTEGAQAIADSRDIRRVALMDKIPYFTTAAGPQRGIPIPGSCGSSRHRRVLSCRLRRGRR